MGLDDVRSDLKRINESAVRSLDEGFEDTLTFHLLGVDRSLHQSLATTNSLESTFAPGEQRTRKEDGWENNNQKQRWSGTALLDIEPRLRRIRGYRSLPHRRDASLEETQQAQSATRQIA